MRSAFHSLTAGATACRSRRTPRAAGERMRAAITREAVALVTADGPKRSDATRRPRRAAILSACAREASASCSSPSRSSPPAAARNTKARRSPRPRPPGHRRRRALPSPLRPSTAAASTTTRSATTTVPPAPTTATDPAPTTATTPSTPPPPSLSDRHHRALDRAHTGHDLLLGRRREHRHQPHLDVVEPERRRCARHLALPGLRAELRRRVVDPVPGHDPPEPYRRGPVHQAGGADRRPQGIHRHVHCTRPRAGSLHVAPDQDLRLSDRAPCRGGAPLRRAVDALAVSRGPCRRASSC